MRRSLITITALILCAAFVMPASAMTSRGTYDARATNNRVVVSNSTDEPDAHVVEPAVYKIEGYNYFRLRDIAMLLNGSGKQFSVDYDDLSKSVAITSGKPYQAIGGELTGTAEASARATVSNNTVTVNGEPVTLTVFKINGFNYFKLRDLGRALDFSVGYDDETKTVYISGAHGYTEEEGTVTGEAEEIVFRAVNVRTDGYHDGALYPRTAYVGSADELRAYTEAEKEFFDMAAFEEAAAGYGESFFRDHYLIIVLLEEGSGSISHTVTSVTHTVRGEMDSFLSDFKDGTVPVPDVINVGITRNVPEVGTDDMAEYHIIIEIPRTYWYGPSAYVSVDISSDYEVNYVSATDGFSKAALSVPRGWTCDAEDYDADRYRETGILYSLVLKSGSRDDGEIELVFTDADVAAGASGTFRFGMGMYDVTGTQWYDKGTGKWREAVLSGTGVVNCRIINRTSEEWWNELGHKAEEILGSLVVYTDFTFSLRWGVYGISSYDMGEGRLVKTNHATHPEEYVAKYVPDTDTLKSIISLLREFDIDSYPKDYDPLVGVWSVPYDTLEISIRHGAETKTVYVGEVAINARSDDPAGQRFLDVCRGIASILMATDEWKALPEYEFLYE